MEYKMVRMYNAVDIFNKVRETFGEDIEGRINEIYEPPCTGAYPVYIPSREMMTGDNCDYAPSEIKLFHVLLQEPDIVPGDTIWIEVDY